MAGSMVLLVSLAREGAAFLLRATGREKASLPPCFANLPSLGKGVARVPAARLKALRGQVLRGGKDWMGAVSQELRGLELDPPKEKLALRYVLEGEGVALRLPQDAVLMEEGGWALWRQALWPLPTLPEQGGLPPLPLRAAGLALIRLVRELIPRYQAMGWTISCPLRWEQSAPALVLERPKPVLYGYSELRRGIGLACAKGMLAVGEARFALPEAWAALRADAPYVRVEGYCFAARDLQAVGFGPSAQTGLPLASSLRLTADELFLRGGARLDGPWRHMELTGFCWEKDAAAPVRGHLEFLTHWGLPGGVLGGAQAALYDMTAFIRAFCTRNPGCKTLMLGSKNLLDGLRGQLDALTLPSGCLELATPKELDGAPPLDTRVFDLLLLLEPDQMTKTADTQVFALLNRVKARLRLAVYADGQFMNREATLRVQMRLLHAPSDWTARYRIVDPAAPLPPLPRPYAFRRGDKREEPPLFSALVLEAAARPSQAPQEPPAPRPEVGASFVKEAKRLAGRSEGRCPFMLYGSEWPSYAGMRLAQQRYYFYWREQARQRAVVGTDSGYVRLYAYELIQQTGGESPEQALEQLRWLRAAYPTLPSRLTGLLAQWEMDLTLLHFPQASLWPILRCLDRPAGALVDKELTAAFTARPLGVTLEHLQYLLGPRLTGSRFYTQQSALLDRLFPVALALADSWGERRGQRLIQRYPLELVHWERYLFQGAPYEGKRTLVITGMPLSAYSPLCAYLRSVLRRVENAVRRQMGVKGQLKEDGVLEEELGLLLDQWVKRQLAPKAQPTRVVLDAARLARLRREAEETQMLLTLPEPEEGEAAPGAAEVQAPDAKERPGDAVQPVAQAVQAAAEPVQPQAPPFPACLTPLQRKLLKAMAEGAERPQLEAAARLEGAMLDMELDAVNEAAQEALGDLLIVQDALLPEYIPMVKEMFHAR